ncbi:MFS transporter [Nakamurella sp. A5-74]|uniref:MFS transporter n=1 Tax=Nakamurella sp. A5-74 TaxID=3158264 RepID=A0AAU8DL65_9ACTN
MTGTRSADDFRWGPILVPAYGPSALASVGAGALVPIVPLTATAEGAGIGVAALVVALAAVGQLCGDLPAGAIATRLGERRALILAGLVDAAAMVLAYLSTSLFVLGLAVFVSGLSGSVFNLARHSWMTVAVPLRFRARALSSLGGVTRIGAFLGPFAAAATVSVWNVHAVYLLAAATGIGATLIAAGVRDLDDTAGRSAAPQAVRSQASAQKVTIRSLVSSNRGVLRTLGVGVLLLCVARASRDSVLPLWAEAQQLDPATISIIFGIAAGLELLLVYPGGAAMDRFGRVAVGVPATAAIGLGLLLLPLTSSAVGIAVLACVMGMGNGLSSGLVLTLGSDAAPAVGRSQFLGIWRLFADVGRVGGPGLVALIAIFAPLAVGSLAVGAVSMVGSWWLAHFSPQLVQRRARRSTVHDPPTS